MSQEIVAKAQEQEMEISAEDVKQYIAPNATDTELYFFCNIARSFGLNPFKKEIHFVKYGDKPGQTIVGYETYIKRAERTGLLDGWSVWMDKDNIGEKAVIKIHRKDRNYSFVWEAYRREFDKQQSTWKAMPYFMLKKVAISQGFRLAFPEEVGGMPYTPDEINVVDAEYQSSASQSTQAAPSNNAEQDSRSHPQSQQNDAQEPTTKQLQTLNMQLEYLGLDRPGKLAFVNDWLQEQNEKQVESSKQIPRKLMSGLIDRVKEDVKLHQEGDKEQAATEKMDELNIEETGTQTESQEQ